jgi:tRNA dimethylallyltransferase
MLPAFHDCLILTGPTASGKSALAMEFARKANAEILAMDSMTLYRGMDIGTAKPTPEDQKQVPHHLLDVLEPTESASVAWWLKQAEQKAEEIRQRGRRPLFVGGTPFYLKAMVHGLFDSPVVDPAIRKELEREAAELGAPALHEELVKVDPKTAERLHPNDAQRIVRALEVYRQTGKPLSELQTQAWFEKKPEPLPMVEDSPQILVLNLDREKLYERINSRVDVMIQQGWLEEVRSLFAHYPNISREASQAVGYGILKSHLEDKVDLSTALELIKTKTRQFAKHQLTWFRNSTYCLEVEIAEVFLKWNKFML